MKDLPERIEENLEAHGLVAAGDQVLLAVSGGVDSMVLLWAMAGLAEKRGWKLTLAHFNHQLRGRASAADEAVVRRAAARLRIPLAVGRGDVRAHAKRNGVSLEMAARELRHRFLARQAVRRGIPAIALAHHADDQVELFFLRLLRGSGGEALGGMKWRAPSPAAPQINLLRPLLNLSKAALRDYAATHRIPYREDASNRCLDVLRNRVRQELLPLLERNYQPALRKTIPRVMEILREEAEFVAERARSWSECLETPGAARACDPARPPSPEFAALPVALQRAALRQQLRVLGLAADFGTLETLRLAPGKATPVAADQDRAGAAPASTLVVRTLDGAVRFEKPVSANFSMAKKTIQLQAEAGTLEFGALALDWSVGRRGLTGPPLRKGAEDRTSSRGEELFDADEAGRAVVLRHWHPGDRFQPIGMPAAVKLQDLFVNQKIPQRHRRNLVIAATESGEVFWVEGLRIGERCKVTAGTRRLLRWRWRRG